MFDGVLKIVKSWNRVDRDALLGAVEGLAALVVAASGVTGTLAKQFKDGDEYISGAALLQNVGRRSDAKYLASAAIVAVAAAVQSHLDAGNYNEDAVRRSLTALFLSGHTRELLPTAAEAADLEPFVAEALELGLIRTTTEQVGLIGAAFGIEAPLKFAMQIREATVLKRAEHIGNGILDWLLDATVDVDKIHEDIVLGRDDDESEIYKILSGASEIPAADEPHAFADGVVPVFDTLLERVGSVMVTGETALRVAKAKAVLEACAGVGRNTQYQQGQYEFKDICRLPRRHIAALGVASACLAVLQHADDVDPDVATVLLASICAAGQLMLLPSAMECEQIKVGASLLDSLVMMPERDDTAAIQAFWMRGAAQNEKCDYLSAEADRLLEEAITEKAYDPMRRVRESELDRETGKMPETDDGPDEGDRYGANPWWLKDLKELFKKRKQQSARMGPELVPSKANLHLAKQLATMPLEPVTTKAPEPLDPEAMKAMFEKLFRAPKRRAGAYGDKKKSPAKPREDPTKKTKAKDDNPFSILNEPFGGGDDADTAARDLFS